MKISEMIEVLQAAEMGEKIEFMNRTKAGAVWEKVYCWDFNAYDYRIAPKKEMTLVEELREGEDPAIGSLWNRAADRIEELEKINHVGLGYATNAELHDELWKRLK